MIIIIHGESINLFSRLIRLSSPNLNYLIIVGSLLVYSSAIGFAVPVWNEPSVLTFCFVSKTSSDIVLSYG